MISKLNQYSQCTVVSTFAGPHEPTLQPKARKRASAFPALFGKAILSNAQKNKINLCFVDSFVQIENDLKNTAK